MPERLPFTKVYVGTRKVTDYVSRVEVREGYGLHSMALIDITTPQKQTPAYRELSPVMLDFGRIPTDTARWYGYIHHSSQMASGTNTFTVTRYVCIGTTLPMDRQKTRSWKNVSPTTIVRQVGRENGLRTIITPSSRRLQYWAQQGESDFKLVKDLAKETGFRFWVDGSTLYFLDPRLLLAGQTTIPVFSKNQSPGIFDTLQDFSIISGTMVPREGGITGQSEISGLDLKTGSLIKASSPPDAGVSTFLNRITTNRAVDTYADAVALAEAATLGSRGWITMQAQLYGTAKISPGSLIGIGGSSVAPEHRGRWLVTFVKHIINRNDENKGQLVFTTTVEAERDQPHAVTFRSSVNRKIKFKTVPAVLRNGQFWESSVLEDINVG